MLVLCFVFFRWFINECTDVVSPLAGGRVNLDLNALKTVEMVVDYRKSSASLTPIPLCDSVVYTVESAAEEMQPAKDYDGALLLSCQ